MNLPFLLRLYAHMEWADALMWQTLLTDDSVGGDEFILDSATHLHLVQRAYLSVWKGQPVEPAERADFAGPAEIRDWARAYYPEAVAFFGDLTEEGLADVVPIPWTDFIEKEIGGPPAPASLGDMAVQVASHSVHHRAQINRRIREVGGSPGMVDYIGWVWRGCPPAAW